MTLNQFNLIVGVIVGLFIGSLFRRPHTTEEQRMDWREPIRKTG